MVADEDQLGLPLDGSRGLVGSGNASSKPVYTTDQIVHQLDTGDHWSGQTITFSFPTAASGWVSSSTGSEYQGFSAFNAAQQAAAREVIKRWDDLIAPDFVEAAASTPASIEFANTTTNIQYAYAYYPGTSSMAGTIWMNSNEKSGNNNLVNPTLGQWGYMTFIHETGHAIGLSHPGDYNGGSPTYSGDAIYMQDSQQYTLMSYFTSDNTGSDWIASDGKEYYPQTPMLDDILAIQAIYGVSTTTRAENTTYGFNSNTNAAAFNFAVNPHPVLAIFDSAGIDTLDLSGWNTTCSIDLTPGGFSSADNMTNNIAIAFSCVIENARGGGGNDVINGNSADNLIEGLNGSDALSGGSGQDSLRGGGGSDSLYGGDGVDTAFFGGNRADFFISDLGGDTFVVADRRGGAPEGKDQISGIEYLNFQDGTFDLNHILDSNPPDPIVGTAKADRLVGDGLRHVLMGLAGNDTLDGGKGHETLIGGVGSDTYIVSSDDKVVENPGEGTDLVNAYDSYVLSPNIEKLVLLGAAAINGTGNDLNNTLTGNAANNVLDGGVGKDSMTGGAGDDTYSVDNGGDRITEKSGGGYDLVLSSTTYTLASQVEALTLTGGGNINGTGNTLSNVLAGNSGANALNGGSGDDRLIGGGGADILTGGRGSDQFVFNAFSESSPGARDQITDFTRGQDKINLSGIDAVAMLDGDQAFSFVGSDHFHNVAGELRFDVGVVQGDINGDGVADFEIAVKVVKGVLDASDFIL